MANVELDRAAFDGHLSGINQLTRSSSFMSQGPVQGTVSRFDVVTEMVAALNRIEAVIGLYRQKLEHDAVVSASACDQLEQVDLNLARHLGNS
ncbi:MAG: hypothetical protein FWD83_10960 [Promicromonosporaceae bacterium]|nr:hypothetical protein [Promicromonosporaceae bacterium]